MKPLLPENQALFRAARASFEPTTADRERIGRSVGGAVGVALVTASSASAAATAGAGVGAKAAAVAPVALTVPGITAFAGVKWMVVASLVLALGGAVALRPGPPAASVPRSVEPARAPPGVTESVAAPREIPAIPPPPPVRPAAPPAPVARAVATASPAALPKSEAPAVSVVEEARLLRDADSAIKSGDLSRAATLLEAYERTFPRAVLAEEHDAERALLECASGATRLLSERFLSSHPSSPLAPRVRSACP